MAIFVRYVAPVLVEVDLEHDGVVGVHVDDERVEGPGDVFAIDHAGPVPVDAARARRVPEAADWPIWTLGP